MNDFSGLFIKIGQLEHLISLQQEGLIFCQTLQYFANLKDEMGKGDNLENVVSMKYYENATLYIIPEDNNPEKILSINISGSHKYKRIVSHGGNLFCLYTVNFHKLPFNQVQDFEIDDKLGTHALIIKSELFFKKLDQALSKLGYNYYADFVDYMDFSKYSGEKSFYQKDITFAKQREYRILIEHPQNEILQFNIGNIEEISELIPVKTLLKMVVCRPDKQLQKNIKTPIATTFGKLMN